MIDRCTIMLADKPDLGLADTRAIATTGSAKLHRCNFCLAQIRSRPTTVPPSVNNRSHANAIIEHFRAGCALKQRIVLGTYMEFRFALKSSELQRVRFAVTT